MIIADPETLATDETTLKVETLFKSGQARYLLTYSPIDFDALNLTTRLSEERTLLARGHFSNVFSGMMDNRTRVAIKVLHLPAYTPDHDHEYESVILRFFRELDVWGNLRHPNIAQMLGYTLAHGDIGLVSLWYHHGNLLQYLKSNPVASKHNLALDVAEGLEYLHTLPQALIHRDLKGINILVSVKGVACLADFGISKKLNAGEGTGFTTSGGISGTTPWMAPELFEDPMDCTRASDVYAFAGVIIEIFCSGKRPFHYLPSEAKVILAKHVGEVPDASHYSEISGDANMWGLLVRCWNFGPQQRPDIQEIVRILYDMFALRPRVIQSILIRPPATLFECGGAEDNIAAIPLGSRHDTACIPSEQLYLSNVALDGQGLLSQNRVLLVTLVAAEERYARTLILTKRNETNRVDTSTLNPDNPLPMSFGILAPFMDISEKFLEMLYVCLDRRSQTSWDRFEETMLRIVQEFTDVYDIYVKRRLAAKQRLSKDLEGNAELCSVVTSLAKKAFTKIPDPANFLDLPLDHIVVYKNFLTTALDGGLDSSLGLKQALSIIETRFRVRMIEWQRAKIPGQDRKWHALVYQGGPFNFLPREENRRQTVLCALIWKEMCFDFGFTRIAERYIQPLERSRDILLGITPKRFIEDVFGGLIAVYHHHRQMLIRLHSIQRKTYPIISSHLILHELLGSISQWTALYQKYIQTYPAALYCIEYEILHNTKFREFHREHQKSLFPFTQDHVIDFIKIAIPRLREYSTVFLQSLENSTPRAHMDYSVIKELKTELDRMFEVITPLMQKSDAIAEVMLIASRLQFNPAACKPKDIKLFNKERKLIHSSILWQRTRDRQLKREVWNRVFAVLLDNYLLLTRILRKNEGTQYVCYASLPLKSLALKAPNLPPQSRGDFNNSFSIELQGKKLKTFSVKSQQDKQEWEEKIGVAIALQNSSTFAK